MDSVQNFEKSVGEIKSFLKDELGAIRGSRPTPALVEDIMVEYYGQKVPLKQVGSISVVLPREIQISAWDSNVVPTIVKVVSEKLSVNAAQDGNTIHVNLPSLTQERRDELIRIVKTKVEDARIKSRSARDDVKKEIATQEKEGEITEDERFSAQEKIQKIIDSFNTDVDVLLAAKISEIQE